MKVTSLQLEPLVSSVADIVICRFSIAGAARATEARRRIGEAFIVEIKIEV
jgi:hypothetical protein